MAPKTLKPSEAAELVGMSEAELRDVNRIPPTMLVQAGSALVVPRPEERLHDVPEDLAENGHVTFASDTRGLRRVSFRAGRRGDSVAAIAQRYHVSAELVAHWNRVGVDGKFRSRPEHRRDGADQGHAHRHHAQQGRRLGQQAGHGRQALTGSDCCAKPRAAASRLSGGR